MMDLRILTLLVVLFGVVYSHTTPHNDEDNFVKIIGMMTKLQEHVTNLENQQQELKTKVMDSMDKQNEKLSNFEAKMMDSMAMQDGKLSNFEVKMINSMAKQNEKISNFEVKVDSLVKENENFEGKNRDFQKSLTEQYDDIKVKLQIDEVGITNNYYGCDNSANMPPTEPPTTTMPPTQPPVVNAQDCTELYSNGFTTEGVYAVYPDGGEAIDVYCQDGWTLLQKRTDDSVNYTRNMEEYERGFGSVQGEHWLGLNAMHKLTEQGRSTVRFEFEDFDGNTTWAEYGIFHVDAAPYHTLTYLLGSYRGTAGDSLGNHGNSFSTFDVDQDGWRGESCSTDYGGDAYGGGGWWFDDCNVFAITTGMPYQPTIHHQYSIYWFDWVDYSDPSMKSVIMKIKSP